MVLDPSSTASLLQVLTYYCNDFSGARRMVPRPKLMFLERAFSTLSTMCSGIFLSAVKIRPNVFGKTTTSPRTRGTPAARPSGLSIANRMQGMSFQGCGRNGSVPGSCQERHLLRLLLVRTSRMTLSIWKKTTPRCDSALPAGPGPCRG